ncbi:hypothetical protein NDU88_008154 [Pleurodeles waltl]|uniref:Uncharacterized protein n=1 Tax=Pleurodeles waltl TaxID=8319 RepID=A0AAV7SUI3_PLEWA|nr:hypothetical protein NDU88_008154 [Pleurodeles waltl]
MKELRALGEEGGVKNTDRKEKNKEKRRRKGALEEENTREELHDHISALRHCGLLMPQDNQCSPPQSVGCCGSHSSPLF